MAGSWTQEVPSFPPVPIDELYSASKKWAEKGEWKKQKDLAIKKAVSIVTCMVRYCTEDTKQGSSAKEEHHWLASGASIDITQGTPSASCWDSCMLARQTPSSEVTVASQDCRVLPDRIFGLELGDAEYIRNAGGNTAR